MVQRAAENAETIYGLKRMIADIARSQEVLGCKLPVRVATLSDPF